MATATINIADRGDVILVVGKDNNVKKLRVDSHFLQAASKPFKVMFGPDFQEGRGLNYDDPREIRLEDADADAMEKICWIVHLKSKSAAKNLDGHSILMVAQAVDKYLFHDAVDLAIQDWLQPGGVKSLAGLLDVLKSALILEQPIPFKEITKILIMQYNDTCNAAAEEDCYEKLMRVLHALDSKRSELRVKFSQAIHETISSVPAEYPLACTCCRHYNAELCLIVRNRNLQPKDVIKKTISKCLKDLKSDFIPPIDAHYAQYCDKGKSRTHTKPNDLWRIMDSKLKPIRDFEGLSLDQFL